MTETRERLTTAALETLRFEGLAGVSARAVANRAGVNQALVFYHFGTLAGLVEAACRGAVDTNVAYYREQFATADSLVDLLELGRGLHTRERDAGNVAVMAQLMAGAQQDDAWAAAARYAMDAWITEIEAVVRRVLAGSPLAEIVDPAGIARAISAGFIGLELYEGVDPLGAASALDALENLGVLIELVDDLGPVARRALRSKLRRRPR